MPSLARTITTSGSGTSTLDNWIAWRPARERPTSCSSTVTSNRSQKAEAYLIHVSRRSGSSLGTQLLSELTGRALDPERRPPVLAGAGRSPPGWLVRDRYSGSVDPKRLRRSRRTRAASWIGAWISSRRRLAASLSARRDFAADAAASSSRIWISDGIHLGRFRADLERRFDPLHRRAASIRGSDGSGASEPGSSLVSPVPGVPGGLSIRIGVGLSSFASRGSTVQGSFEEPEPAIDQRGAVAYRTRPAAATTSQGHPER